MRPSSSSSEPPGLFDGVLSRGPVFAATSSAAWLQAMLDAEAALAMALADAGVVPGDLAKDVASRCRAELFDVEQLGREAVEGGNPVIPLVRALTAEVGVEASEAVHRGATSQDIIDTAMMLVARRSLDHIEIDLDAASSALAHLARIHRATPMAGRTLLQHAVPTTFGLTAAGWMLGLDAAVARLHAVREHRLAAQLGGAAGTLEAFGPAAVEVADRFAAHLGLPAPIAPWHTERSRIAELAGALGGAAGAIGKASTDVVLLAQTDVGELRETASGGRGGSSAMPHKQNPVAAIAARASVLPAPGYVATLLTAMQQHELQRAAGAWHAEWPALVSLLRAVGSGAAWLRECVDVLEVDAGRMQENLAASRGLLLAERVTIELAPALGRGGAAEAVTAACRRAEAGGLALADALAADERVAGALDRARIDEVLDPAVASPSATQLVDRILERRDASRGDA